MSALAPRPGIMKIAPYVPGKDSVEGKETIAKLSSNEGALGPSPKAMAAYAKAAAELHRYPDGGAEKLRLSGGPFTQNRIKAIGDGASPRGRRTAFEKPHSRSACSRSPSTEPGASEVAT